MNIELKIKQTIKKYKICNKKEKIVVALSGGKDSTTTAYILKKLGYNLVGLHIDLGLGEYSEKCLEAVKKLCKLLKITLKVVSIKKMYGCRMCYIRAKVQEKKKVANCLVCGVIKKWIMNREARNMKADKIATGHNLDDECQTFLSNVFKGSLMLSSNSGPISRNLPDSKRKFIPRIKPLFFIPENEIRKFSKKMKLPVVYEKCPCAVDSYRIQIREFLNTISDKEKENIIRNAERIIEKLERKNPEIRYCSECGEPSRNMICKRCELLKG